jgi:hypothetical protein
MEHWDGKADVMTYKEAVKRAINAGNFTDAEKKDKLATWEALHSVKSLVNVRARAPPPGSRIHASAHAASRRGCPTRRRARSRRAWA